MRLLVFAFLGGFAFAAHADYDYIKPLGTVPLVGPGTTGKKLQDGMTVGADIGAGPHKERSLTPAPREDVDEIPAADHPTGNRENGGDRSGSASTGSSRSGDSSIGSSGADNDAIERDEDRANKNKEKFKQRPGYKNDVPLPRASNGK